MLRNIYNVFACLMVFVTVVHAQTDYYTYRSGNWETATVWTTDPSGTTLQGYAVPSPGDNVTILDGRTVTVTANNHSTASLTINAGSTLDLGNTSGHNFGNVSGSGNIYISSMNLPSGTFTDFISPSGGTLKITNNSNQNRTLPAGLTTVNNLIIETTRSNRRIDLGHSITINGNLTLEDGNFRIYNYWNSVTMNISGDLTINVSAALNLGNGRELHQIIVGGDIINNGVMDLSGGQQYEATTSAAEVTLIGAHDNIFTGSGSQTDLYRLIIDKGTDQTYVLSIDVDNFQLYGPTDGTNDDSGDNENPIINKALWIKNGTCKLESGIHIEELSSGGIDFFIPLNGCLWIDGANVEATQPSNPSGNTAITIIGKFKISDGSYNGNQSAGFIYRVTGEIEIDGGTVNISQFRRSGTAITHRASYTQTGGDVIIRGDCGTAGEISGEHAIFAMPFAENVFSMSGGTLTIRDISNPGGTTNAINIACAKSNVFVSGGTINVQLNGNNDFQIYSTANFNNLNISRLDGAAAEADLQGQELVVNNDLTIESGAELNANGLDVTIKGDLVLNGAYTTGGNTTTLNSASNRQKIIINNPAAFNDLVINNTAITGNDSVIVSGTESAFTINNNLEIIDGKFYDDGLDISVAGNLYNGSETGSAGNGKIILSGGASQHVVSGNDNGIFGNLEINDSNGAVITANQTIMDTLFLTSGILDIGSNNLQIGSSGSIEGAFSPATMIESYGNSSDGGLTKSFTAADSFTFPLGTGLLYTPAKISIGSASSYGDVTVIPVAAEHPNVTANDTSLAYYWKVKSSGFSSVSDVDFTYNYVDNSVPPGNSETVYISGAYDVNNYKWKFGSDADVDEDMDIISIKSQNFLDGDFTAGASDAFQDVTIYFSRQSGDWDDTLSWSTEGHNGSAATELPNLASPVVIGDGDAITATTNNISIGSLQILAGSVLDLGTTTGHHFTTVMGSDGVEGTGTLRISSSGGTAVFPDGDFGNFLNGGGGTCEYYGSASFTLPSTVSNYNNLSFNSSGSAVFSLPAIDLTLNGDMNIAAGTVQFSNGAGGDVSIEGDLVMTGGTLRYPNGAARDISVHGDVSIGSGAAFRIASTGTAVTNTLTLEGGLTNNGTFDMNAGSGRICEVTFTGTNDVSIDGSGSTTDFYRLILNKGTSAIPVLDIDLGSFSLSGPANSTPKSLDLQNGTVKLTNSQTLNLSTGGADYPIPANTMLWIDGSTININGSGMHIGGTLNLSAGNLSVEEYITYNSSGYPAITISGTGNLNVGYQIRRPVTPSTGSLNYTQSGGTVTVGSDNSAALEDSRAMFEILNSGSRFNMSGGTLIISRAQSSSPSIASLYILPSFTNVSGGVIQIGDESTPSSQTITVNCNISLPAFSTDNSSGNNPVTMLEVNNLSLLGDLNIAANTTLNTAGLNVYTGGDFTNDGTYTHNDNITFMNGAGEQIITLNNSTNFYDLVINNTSATDEVAFAGTQSGLTIENNLTLTSGILNDGGKVLTVAGTIHNAAVHTSTGSGRILFAGAAGQTISGSGSGQFGNIEIDNSSGVVTSAKITINGTLTFTDGLLNIGSNSLVLGESFSYAGTPSSSRMIVSNGSISDQGITKNFSSGTGSFTFPIGSGTRYAPVNYNITANSAAGQITVQPIQSEHPSTTDAGNDNALNYYWSVSGSGFSGLNLSHTYYYNQTDVDGNESNYHGARFTGTAWEKDGTVNTGANSITFTNTDLNCSYTAGDTSEFGEILTYTSVQTGNWESASTWDNGVPASGAPVIISEGHTVTITAHLKNTASLQINSDAVLNVGATGGHVFGIVSGTGGILLTSDMFPGGNFNSFISSSGGTIGFAGNGDFTIAGPETYNNLIFAGNGTKSFASGNLTINGDLTVQGGTVEASTNDPDIAVAGDLNITGGTLNIGSGVFTIEGAVNNDGALNLEDGTINVSGDWTGNSTLTAGSGTVAFVGNSSSQTIGGTGSETFYNLSVNKSNNHVILDKDVNISNTLTLASHKIITGSNTLALGVNATVAEANDTSFVDGKLSRIFNINSYRKSLTYNTGKNNVYLPITLEIQLDAATSTALTVEQFNSAVPEYAAEPSLDHVSVARYWHVSRGTGANIASGNITLRWNQGDGISDLADLVIAHDQGTGAVWYNEGGTDISGTDQGGTITNEFSFTSVGDFTFGTSTPDNSLPVEMDDSSVKLAANRDGIEITWTTYSEYENSGWVIERRIKDTEEWTEVGDLDGAGNSSTGSEYYFVDKKVPVNNTYEYRLTDISYRGFENNHGPFEIKYEGPEKFEIMQNYPNPFNPVTNIPYNIAVDGTVSLIIYNILGQKVKTLINEKNVAAGYYMERWNGRDNFGNPVASGMYIYRMIFKDSKNGKSNHSIKKMIVMH